jgi:CRP-like cAMP-binding protein
VVDGQVAVHHLARELTQIGPRESFGEMALLDRDPRSASVSATSDVTCLKIERDDFYDLMSERMEIAHGIIRTLSQRLREANERLSVHSSTPRM